MNIQQLLMICAMEESSEVSQELAKCLRFTTDHRPHVYPTTNIERVRLEAADFVAIALLLKHFGVDLFGDMAQFEARVKDKMQRTLDSMKISRELGCLG